MGAKGNGKGRSAKEVHVGETIGWGGRVEAAREVKLEDAALMRH